MKHLHHSEQSVTAPSSLQYYRNILTSFAMKNAWLCIKWLVNYSPCIHVYHSWSKFSKVFEDYDTTDFFSPVCFSWTYPPCSTCSLICRCLRHWYYHQRISMSFRIEPPQLHKPTINHCKLIGNYFTSPTFNQKTYYNKQKSLNISC